MKERPILFSGEMVSAILSGRKTVTRRVIYPQPWIHPDAHLVSVAEQLRDWTKKRPCPYGQPGDRLWVRETHAVIEPISKTEKPIIIFQADKSKGWVAEKNWKPSIHMPRWASRITLEVTGVRVERVQDITSSDAEREGLCWDHLGWMDYSQDLGFKRKSSSRQSFQTLWDSLNAKRGFGWDKNPWVWVIEFKKSTPPLLAGEGKGGV